MRRGLHLRVVGGNDKGSGEVTYMHSINGDDFFKTLSRRQKHTISPSPVPCLTRAHPQRGRLPQPERRLRLEIKTILCVWGLWMGAVMFSIWALRAIMELILHHLDTVVLFALKLRDSIISHSLNFSPFSSFLAAFMKGLICGIKRRGSCRQEGVKKGELWGRKRERR